MQFNTHYKRERQSPEMNSGELLLEKAGYITAQQKIENLINAGARLIQARKDAYDFPDGKIDKTYDDPTRKKNFDMAEAFQLREATRHRLEASQNAPKGPRTASDIKIDVEPVKE